MKEKYKFVLTLIIIVIGLVCFTLSYLTIDKNNLYYNGVVNSKKYKIPNNFPKYSSFGKYNAKCSLYVYAASSDYKENYLIEMNNSGKVLSFKKFPVSHTDPKVYKNKKNHYIYTLFSNKTKDIDVKNNNYNYVVLDEKFKIIKDFSFHSNNELANLHDSLYVNDDTYILAKGVPKKVSIDGKLIKLYDEIVFETVKGKVVWEFHTTDFMNFYKYYDQKTASIVPDDYLDYMHLNSFVIDPKDENLLVSFRNQNAIVKINRKTGKLMWILGGKGDQFGLTEKQKFINQHSISIEKDGSILMYDNGYDNQYGRRNSRITEIKIDEENKKVIDYKTYDLKGVYTATYGTVEEINKRKGIYLITYGYGINANQHNIEEVNLKTGKINFWIDFENQSISHIDCINKD